MAETSQVNLDQNPPDPSSPSATTATSNATRNLQDNAPNSLLCLLGIFAFVISSGGIFPLLAGCLLLTGAVVGFVFFCPLVIITSPLWLPIESILFPVFLSFCAYWRKGHQPPGSNRFDAARSRRADAAARSRRADAAARRADAAARRADEAARRADEAARRADEAARRADEAARSRRAEAAARSRRADAAA